MALQPAVVGCSPTAKAAFEVKLVCQIDAGVGSRASATGSVRGLHLETVVEAGCGIADGDDVAAAPGARGGPRLGLLDDGPGYDYVLL